MGSVVSSVAVVFLIVVGIVFKDLVVVIIDVFDCVVVAVVFVAIVVVIIVVDGAVKYSV